MKYSLLLLTGGQSTLSRSSIQIAKKGKGLQKGEGIREMMAGLILNNFKTPAGILAGVLICWWGEAQNRQ